MKLYHLRPMVWHKTARIIPFHSSRFLAIFSASPQVKLISFISVSTLNLQEVLGLFLLPGGVHLSAYIGVLLFSILSTCSSHLNLLPLISYISILLVLEGSSAFGKLVGPEHHAYTSQTGVMKGRNFVHISIHNPTAL